MLLDILIVAAIATIAFSGILRLTYGPHTFRDCPEGCDCPAAQTVGMARRRMATRK